MAPVASVTVVPPQFQVMQLQNERSSVYVQLDVPPSGDEPAAPPDPPDPPGFAVPPLPASPPPAPPAATLEEAPPLPEPVLDPDAPVADVPVADVLVPDVPAPDVPVADVAPEPAGVSLLPAQAERQAPSDTRVMERMELRIQRS